ncbi:MAG: glutathione peroxidase [Microscillaceae bacterium]|nr:glutathione peroxidase [Microscillaceae bacterium]
MRLLIFTALIFVSTSCGLNAVKTKPEQSAMMTTTIAASFYDFKLKSLDGSEEIDFARYKGKKVLLVNVASKCGFTPQYEQLQALHEQHGDQVVILGFPANNFGGQEPGTHEEIATFCKKNYGVSFQLFEKISVKGNDQHPLYQWLSQKDQNGWNDQAPTWNFCKYLISENGELLKFYGSAVDPMGDEMLKAIGI